MEGAGGLSQPLICSWACSPGAEISHTANQLPEHRISDLLSNVAKRYICSHSLCHFWNHPQSSEGCGLGHPKMQASSGSDARIGHIRKTIADTSGALTAAPSPLPMIWLPIICTPTMSSREQLLNVRGI